MTGQHNASRLASRVSRTLVFTTTREAQMTTHISILPKDLLIALSMELDEKCAPGRSDHSFIRLLHPRTGLASLFLAVFSPNGVSSILELQKVFPIANRSWFNGGEVLSDGSMLLLTPIDPVFLLVPVLKAALPQDGSIGNFRTLDDILEGASVTLAKDELVAGDILELGRLQCVQDAMRKICEAKDIAPDLIVFRYSHTKLIEYLVKKANRLGTGAAIGESRTLERELAKDGLLEDGKDPLLQSGRMKLACDLISQYIAPDIHEELLTKFDFSELTEHVNMLAQTDLAHGTANSNGKVPKGEATEDQNGKKRKAASQASTGVTKLKKANIKGMSKLSSFFQKKS